MEIKETIKNFLDDTYKFEDNSIVIGIELINDDNYIIYLKNTIFYPQGGGQPCDIGIISNEKTKFIVDKVMYSHTKDQVIEHHGKFIDNNKFEIGDNVKLNIDENIRRLHARLHSAGHLLDQAMSAANYNYPTGKGNHRPGESYVEYVGKIDNNEKIELMKKVQIECDRLIHENIPTIIKFEDPKNVPHDTSFLKPGEKARIVCVGGICDYPCAGTHIKNSGELIKLKITKVSCRKGIIRISYTVEDN